jgi:hypothetical protein
MGMDLDLEDEDPDRRPTTLLGRIRRFFDRGSGSSRPWDDWFAGHRSSGWFHGDGASHWGGWGDGGGCDGGVGGCGGGGCGGGGCGSC